MKSLIVGLLPLAVYLVSIVWVYRDADSKAKSNQTVIFSTNLLTISTVAGWVVAVLILWVVFFPLYLVARNGDL